MSLDTLLEAARYLELQEQKARQLVKIQHHVIHVKAAEPRLEPQPAPPPPTTTVVVPLQPQQHHQLQQQPPNGLVAEIPALIIDESQDAKRRHQHHQSGGGTAGTREHPHVPCVMRAGTREVHNKLEKHRRAHLKECFDMLKKQLPPQPDEKKTSNLSILHSALRYIQVLKRKERELEHEMERLAREKISAQQRLATLKKEFASQCDNIDFSVLLPPVTASTPEDAVRPLPTVAVSATAEDGGAASANEPRMTTLGTTTAAAGATTTQGLQTVSVLPLSQMGYHGHQGLVVGLHKVALVSKSLTPLVSSPVTHIITPSQLNGKVVPLVNAQYLVKPVVVVSSPSVATTISPRPS